MGCNKPVHVAKEESISWPKKFDTRNTQRHVVGCGGVSGGGGGVEGGGEEEGDIMAGVGLDDFRSGDREEEVIHFTIGVLDYEGCIINSLAVSHYSLSLSFFEERERDERERVDCCSRKQLYRHTHHHHHPFILQN